MTRYDPRRNHGYCNPKNALHTQALSKKITPPPRSTIVECDDLSFGLSIMLYLSAMRKYTISATNSSRKINK